MAWMRFADMHSGGGIKFHGAEDVLIELDEGEGVKDGVWRFTRATGLDPDHVTCSCCGRDYLYHEELHTLASALAECSRAAWVRGCRVVLVFADGSFEGRTVRRADR